MWSMSVISSMVTRCSPISASPSAPFSGAGTRISATVMAASLSLIMMRPCSRSVAGLVPGESLHFACWGNGRGRGLEDSLLLRLPQRPRFALILVVGIFGGHPDVLPFLQLRRELLPLLGERGQPAWLRLLGRLGLGRPQRRDLLLGVAAPQLGVGGHGQVPRALADLLPPLAVLLGLRQLLLLPAV